MLERRIQDDGVRHTKITSPPEHFTEETLFKVYKALRRAGMSEEQAERAINEMQNAGILFREKVSILPQPTINWRGGQPEGEKFFEKLSERTKLPRDGA